MNQLESRIRDYLVENLSFISDDFQLIAKEYYLKNAIGTRGFIDILAKDKYENFVIIEIKRSNQAAKQAIHEVFKYAALLKQNLKVKESEIRIIIISSVWDELIVPFSDFHAHTKYPVEGYNIELDNNGTPVAKKLISPVNNLAVREFSRQHLVFLYHSKEEMVQAIEIISHRLKQVGILDFVIFEFSHKSPYGVYIAFQRYSKIYYLEQLSQFPELVEQYWDFEEYAEDEIEIIDTLENLLLGELKIKYDDVESSYPEKLLTHTEIWGWEIGNIRREGFFADDRRLSDEMIVNEVKGLKGGSVAHYSNFTHSKFKSRIEEILKDVSNQLESNDIWLQHIKFAVSSALEKEIDCDIAIEIYNPPDSVLTTLHKMTQFHKFGVPHPLFFLPNYVLQICFFDEENTIFTYLGRIKWNGNEPTFDEFSKKIFKGNANWYVERSFMLTHNLTPWIEPQIMNSLGFQYSTDVQLQKNGKLVSIQHDIRLDGDKLYDTNPDNLYHLEDFLVNSLDFLAKLNTLYNNYLVVY